MAYRTVQTRFWTDPDVRKLRPDSKLLFMYLITNPHTHLSGLYYLPTATMAAETGLHEAEIDTLLATLSNVVFERPSCLVWVKRMFGHQAKGEKAHRAAARHLVELHNTVLIKQFLTEYPAVKPYLPDTLSYGSPLQEQEQEQEQDQDQDQDQDQEQEQDSARKNGALAVRHATPAEVVDLWNTSGLKHTNRPTGPLMQRLKTRLREHPDMIFWQDLFARIGRSAFLTGKKTDWVATFDWVLRPTNLAKILAGNYDNDKRRGDGLERMLAAAKGEGT